ncbi:MAG: hypothetical protein RLZZ274_221, partial [Cyanobacteriota bacterium]
MEAVMAAMGREHHIKARKVLLGQELGATGRHPRVVE